jgi:GntR family transcriptional regulator, transcriptional repressor for pyruvate dehydrogenase complex
MVRVGSRSSQANTWGLDDALLLLHWSYQLVLPVSMNASSKSSVAEGVAATVMSRVLGGSHGAGARLPSEREIAAELGVARVSVREAFALLDAWCVLRVRPGSGAVVQPRQAWTMDALALVLSHLFARAEWVELGRIVSDAFELRRALVLDVLSRAGRHLQPGALDPARRALELAVRARADRPAFLAADRRIIPTVLEAAGMWPSLWLLNSMASPYLAVVGAIGASAAVEPKYREAHLTTFTALEANDAEAARARFDKHLRAADRLMIDSFPPGLKQQLSIVRSP